jgi:hypothetical protein
MQIFKDDKGREWRLSINSATVERVRHEIAVDLLEYGTHGEDEDFRHVLQFQVRANPVLLTRILHALVKRQAEDAGIDYETFAEEMTGDRLFGALEPLETEIINFTVNPDQRAAVGAAIRKLSAMMDATMRAVRAQTENLLSDPRIDRQHARALEQLAEQSGSLLASLDAETQDRAPTAN